MVSTTDKRYQVFICSTHEDLSEARQSLVQGLLALGILPVGLETLGPDGYLQWNQQQKLINDSDYVVVLLGGRYGELSPIGLSYGHREFVHAITRRKPVVALLHDHPDMLPPPRREQTREGESRFRDYRKLVQDKSLARMWAESQEVGELIRRFLPTIIRQHPAQGWVRAGDTATADQGELTRLRERVAQLEQDKEELIAGLRPPLDSLAKGSDPVLLHYSANVFVGGDCKITPLQAELTWDDLLAAVGPALMAAVPEARLRTAVEERLAQQALTDAQQVIPRAHAVRNVVLPPSQFNQVKVQLRALGYIRRVPGEGDGESRWQLTPLGDVAMTQRLTHKRR